VILVVNISDPATYVIQRRPVSGDRALVAAHPATPIFDFRRAFRTPTANKKGAMDWTIIGVNFLYAALGVVLMWVAYRLFDRLTPQVDFAEELKKGNIAVAIFIAALFIAIALIVGRALN
jgi:hypothetical protein